MTGWILPQHIVQNALTTVFYIVECKALFKKLCLNFSDKFIVLCTVTILL